MQEKSDFILAFTDATVNLVQVGGKGASLARMAIAGLPVPNGERLGGGKRAGARTAQGG